MNLIVNWVSENYFELFASGLGFVAIFLQIRQNVWYWLVSIIMVSMYIYIYIDAKLYADMSLQVYFLVISFYGWYMWLFGNKQNHQRSELKVSSATKKMIGILTLITIFLFFFIAWILITFTNSDLPYWDSFTTALSFVATWMLARKILENWLIWILVDAVSIGIYIYKDLYPTAVLFLFLTVLAFVGYARWKKDLNQTVPRAIN
ncbi:MAG: nicotinamide mononucleotide transporter [Cyclobacteriaceae bacterium]|nr:nicotinamide mononucleotide transporter [Cyclobacteriaceae bacterium]MCK5368764.1 nicotinamide mononucleotide transporter [Cyclobacteriaceae bacterium]